MENGDYDLWGDSAGASRISGWIPAAYVLAAVSLIPWVGLAAVPAAGIAGALGVPKTRDRRMAWKMAAVPFAFAALGAIGNGTALLAPPSDLRIKAGGGAEVGTVSFLAASIFLFCVSASFHEASHALGAYWWGDATAHSRGRLTLNPLSHIDPIGTVLLPVILGLSGAAGFGWARPTPFEPRNLRNRRLGEICLSAAGPLSNLVLAAAGAQILALLLLGYGLAWPSAQIEGLANPYALPIGSGVPGWALNLLFFVKIFIWTNLGLALFNLLPFPPLDGSWIVGGFLPDPWRAWWERMRGLLAILLLVLIFTRSLGMIFVPVQYLWEWLVQGVIWMTFF